MKTSAPFLSALCLAAIVVTAPAAPLQRADIPPHPAWVLHVDCDALRETYLGKYLLYQLDKPEMKSNMVAFQSIFTFDLRTQVHGLTMYNDGLTSDDGVILLYADFDADKLAALMLKAPEASSFTHQQHVIYSCLKNPGENDGLRKYVAFKGHRILSSVDRESLLDALAVMDGAVPTLAGSKNWPELGATTGSNIVQAAAHKLDFLDDPSMDLLKMSKQAHFQASETDEQFKATLTAELENEATAKQTSLAFQGILALLGLQKDNPAAKLAAATSVKQTGPAFTATLAIPSTELVAALKAYNAKKAKP